MFNSFSVSRGCWAGAFGLGEALAAGLLLVAAGLLLVADAVTGNPNNLKTVGNWVTFKLNW